MARSRLLRLSALAIGNLLIPISVLVFASGFFPYKPFLPGLATFQDDQEQRLYESGAAFDRVVLMVVDALRSDFVYGYNSGFEYTQSLIRTGAVIPFTAHATPPTVTMPRVKALTTGSVPSFLDLILNFAESDTTSSLSNQDTWLAQIKAKGGKLVFYGDDTWLKLFPGDFFARADGTSSFFVSDFTEVDNNVTRHVPDELKRDDWNAMILHYLGLDHIGHKTGPNGPKMLPKQREMDGIVQQIFEAIESYPHHAKTLLVLAGDHGMNAGGNHGGSGPGETEPALLFASPAFRKMRKRLEYKCPTLPKAETDFHYYTKVEQSDIVPVLAGLMGLPISMNSLGVFIPEFAGIWSAQQHLAYLWQNSNQILNIVRANDGAEKFDLKVQTDMSRLSNESYVSEKAAADEDLAFEWSWILHNLDANIASSSPEEAELSYYRFLYHAQEAMSNASSSYDIPRMMAGLALAFVAFVCAALFLPSLWPPSCASIFFSIISVLYGAMMFASSYVEEEQHFWYWLTPAWILCLGARSLGKATNNRYKTNIAIAGAGLFLTHRLAVRWNQTGQKHAGDPDIVHTIFPEHHVLMWVLVLITYVVNCTLLHTRTFAGILMTELAVFVEVSLTFLAIVFKLNFTQADAPELVQGLATLIREYSKPFSLVQQAQAVFGLLAIATILMVTLSIRNERTGSASREAEGYSHISLLDRLHHLLALFLMTQTRAPNVPLFLVLEIQRLCLGQLTAKADSKSPYSNSPPTEVATSALLFSNVFYFCMGGSNSISSIDLSNAYNGVADYNITAVGVLLFASNWAGAIWWCSGALLFMLSRQVDSIEEQRVQPHDDKDWVMVEHSKLHNEAVASTRTKDSPSNQQGPEEDYWSAYLASMTFFTSISLVAVMAACTALRTHLFIWTVFSPKYLYAMAWSVGWHSIVNLCLGTVLYLSRRIA